MSGVGVAAAVTRLGKQIWEIPLRNGIMKALLLLEGMACYAGQLLVLAEGFGFGFFPLFGKIKGLLC